MMAGRLSSRVTFFSALLPRTALQSVSAFGVAPRTFCDASSSSMTAAGGAADSSSSSSSSPPPPPPPSSSLSSSLSPAVAPEAPRRVQARKKDIRGSPQKLNQLAKLIRGLPVPEAKAQMQFSKRRPSKTFWHLITNAANNADIQHGIAEDQLRVRECYVNKGAFMKRVEFKARGRVGIKHKPFSHITVVVEEMPALGGEEEVALGSGGDGSTQGSRGRKKERTRRPLGSFATRRQIMKGKKKKKKKRAFMIDTLAN
eukprot:g6284.t1